MESNRKGFLRAGVKNAKPVFFRRVKSKTARRKIVSSGPEMKIDGKVSREN